MSGSDRGTPEPFGGQAQGGPPSGGPASGAAAGGHGQRGDAVLPWDTGTDVSDSRHAADSGLADSGPASDTRGRDERGDLTGPGGLPGDAVHPPDGPTGTAGHEGAAGGGEPAATGRRISRPQAGRDRGRGSFLRELPILVLVAFLLALLIKTVFVQAFWIPSESMERTLLIDDRVLVNKVIYHFRDVHRGEIVVFNGEGTGFERESIVAPPANGLSRFIRGAQELLGLGAPSEKDFIKRVIGVGGDVVACCDAAGRVTVNGKALDEPYVYENDFQAFGPFTVPDGDLWLMGDHRSRSSDSRQNGPVPQDKVIGRAFVRVWPLGRFGLLTVPGTFSGIPSASAAPARTPAPTSDETAPSSPPGAVGVPGSTGSADLLIAPVGALALAVPASRRRRSGGRRSTGGRSIGWSTRASGERRCGPRGRWARRRGMGGSP
ncbi:signal peptidase I [Parafrankia sp. EAN1pec]|uniref:signal peptidase I n=1 Tax=Parafrankia sp. (strain EAN1pec) TaxID=298653 RepID=UPI000054217B|nr:signal peptidase I [Frankia sp. EAN1pec]